MQWFYYRTIKFQSKRKYVVEEEIVETETESKQQKLQEQPEKPTISTDSPSSSSTTVVVKKPTAKTWNKSIGGLSRNGPLVVKKSQSGGEKVAIATTSKNNVEESGSENKIVSNGLSLLGAYSDSENSD